MHVEVPAHVMWAGARLEALNNDYATAQRSLNAAYLQANIGRMELERALVEVRCAHTDQAAHNVALRAEIQSLEQQWRAALIDHAAVASVFSEQGTAS